MTNEQAKALVEKLWPEGSVVFRSNPSKSPTIKKTHEVTNGYWTWGGNSWVEAFLAAGIEIYDYQKHGLVEPHSWILTDIGIHYRPIEGRKRL